MTTRVTSPILEIGTRSLFIFIIQQEILLSLLQGSISGTRVMKVFLRNNLFLSVKSVWFLKHATLNRRTQNFLAHIFSPTSANNRPSRNSELLEMMKDYLF